MTGKASAAALYRFVLFVAGDEPNSALAHENLKNIVAEYLLAGVCTITIVDVLRDFQAALDDDILVTPTLVVNGPRGRSTIIGNLAAIDRIVLAIGCS